MTLPSAGLTVALALGAGVVAQSVSRQLRIPGIILLLAVGAGLGPEGLGWVAPASLGDGLFGIVEFGVAIILFEGGLNLEWSRLKRQEAAIRRLISLGAVTTLIGGTLLARLVLDWSWPTALLFGSLVIVTGPTVVAPLLRDLRLHPRLKTILEAEGVLIDPIGALVAVFVLHVVTAPAISTVAVGVGAMLGSVTIGTVAGLLAGGMLAGALRYRLLVAPGFETIVTLASVILLFELCEHVAETSGLLAVTVAGIVVGNVDSDITEELREFKDRLTVLLVGLLFVLLAANVSFDDVRALGQPGVAVVAGLVLVVRPIGVWLSTRATRLSTADRLFTAAIGPRGIVAAAIATLTAAALRDAGHAGGDALTALVFLCIAGTVVISGVAARPIAWLLALQLPRRDRVMIAGATGLAIALATELRAAATTVIFVESDPKRCRVVEEAGFTVVFGDPLEERTMLRARPELAGSVIGMTFNEHFNGLFVRHATDRFHIPAGYVAMASLYGDRAPAVVTQASAQVLFDGPRDHERWDSRWRHRQVAVERFEYRSADLGRTAATGEGGDRPPGDSRSLDRFVILTVTRGRSAEPMYAGRTLRDGDSAAVAVFTPQRDDARRALAARGWTPA